MSSTQPPPSTPNNNTFYLQLPSTSPQICHDCFLIYKKLSKKITNNIIQAKTPLIHSTSSYYQPKPRALVVVVVFFPEHSLKLIIDLYCCFIHPQKKNRWHFMCFFKMVPCWTNLLPPETHPLFPPSPTNQQTAGACTPAARQVAIIFASCSELPERLFNPKPDGFGNGSRENHPKTTWWLMVVRN